MLAIASTPGVVVLVYRGRMRGWGGRLRATPLVLVLLVWACTPRGAAHESTTLGAPAPETQRVVLAADDVPPRGVDAHSPCVRRAAFQDPAESDYVLPFPVGERYVVRQSYCLAHGGHSNQLAYDFAMPIGAEIVAARAGEVVALFEDAPDGEVGANNYVFVLHGDGTVAMYAHLTHLGVDVEIGQHVNAGQPIGRSGSSGLGLENTPHLHFGVYRTWPNVEGDDVAVNFSNAEGPLDMLGGLVMGASYEALADTVPSHPITPPGDYSGAELRNAVLSGFNLWDFDFSSADLSGADASRADLAWASLDHASLIGADLSYADLTGANLTGADLSEALLVGSDMTRANLRDAVLRRADLTGAYLAITNLIGADLDGARLDGATMIGVHYDDSTRWPEGFVQPPQP